MWRQPRVFLTLIPPTLESLTLRGIPPGQVYNLTFRMVFPGGYDPEPPVRKCGDSPGCFSHCYLPPWRVLLCVLSHPAKYTKFHSVRLSLEVMTLNPVCENVETAQGVPLTVTGVAQVISQFVCGFVDSPTFSCYNVTILEQKYI